MSQGPDLQESMYADAGGVEVEKSYEPEEFPVPAIRFRITAPDEAASVRLTDEIPESFPMDRVGFHPEFESDNWTAYQNHRVEFTRDLEAGETVVTVYGIRIDDESEVAAFLDAPALERTDAAGAASSEVADVIGEDSSDAVREVVADEDTSLAGLDEAKADRKAAETDIEAAVAAAEAEADAPEPDDEAGAVEADEPDDPLAADEPEAADGSLDDAGQVDAGGSDAVPADDESDDEPVPDLDLADPADDETTADDVADEDVGTGAERAGEASDESPSAPDGQTEEPAPSLDLDEEPSEADATGDEDASVAADATGVATAGSAGTPDSGLAAQLAAEIRSGEVADDDLALLREELDLGVPRSVDARISKLQTQMSDMEAYTQALERFIDEEGSAQEVVESFERDLEDVSASVDSMAGRIADAETERAELDAELHGLADEVDDVAGRLEEAEGDVAATESRVVDLSTELDEVAGTVATAESDVSSLTEWVEDHESDISSLNDEVAAVESDVEAVADRVDALATRVDSVESDQYATDDVEAAVDDLESDVDSIRDELDDVQQFRERINSAFGSGPGGE